jgi:hypothetical protein
MQMEVMTRHEFACLAMVFPKFKEMPGRKRDNWRPRPLATILLDKIAKFIHHYRRLNNNTLADVNLGDRTKTCLSKTLDLSLSNSANLRKCQSSHSSPWLVEKVDKHQIGINLCELANKPNPAPIRQRQQF